MEKHSRGTRPGPSRRRQRGAPVPPGGHWHGCCWPCSRGQGLRPPVGPARASAVPKSWKAAADAGQRQAKGSACSQRDLLARRLWRLAQEFGSTKAVPKCGNDNGLLLTAVPTVFTSSVNEFFFPLRFSFTSQLYQPQSHYVAISSSNKPKRCYLLFN